MTHPNLETSALLHCFKKHNSVQYTQHHYTLCVLCVHVETLPIRFISSLCPHIFSKNCFKKQTYCFTCLAEQCGGPRFHPSHSYHCLSITVAPLWPHRRTVNGKLPPCMKMSCSNESTDRDQKK